MKIIADTREQRVLEFSHPFITGIIRRKLDVGDYAVEFEDGYIPGVRYERKSITDLFGTLGGGYGRFKKEIVRAQKAQVALIIITENTLSEVGEGIDHSIRSGNSILSQLFTLLTRYSVQTVFCNGRDECAEYITQHFLAIGREYVKNKGKPPPCSAIEGSKTQEA